MIQSGDDETPTDEGDEDDGKEEAEEEDEVGVEVEGKRGGGERLSSPTTNSKTSIS